MGTATRNSSRILRKRLAPTSPPSRGLWQYQGDKWIAEITASSPSEAVQAVCEERGLNSTDGMKAIEFNPDVNDQNVRFVPYGHADLEDELETEAE